MGVTRLCRSWKEEKLFFKLLIINMLERDKKIILK